MPLDIGIGVLAAILVSRTCATELSLGFVAVGVLFALLPDVDFIYTTLTNGWRDYRAVARHRDLIHYPTIYLPIGAIVLSQLGGDWVLLFLLTSLGHFIHDSIGIGWGIPWLWPISNYNYSFFYKYSPRYHHEHPRRLIYGWPRERMDELISRYGDRHWFWNIYCRPHPFFIVELAFFVAAVVTLWKLE